MTIKERFSKYTTSELEESVKDFNKDMTCRNFKYEENKKIKNIKKSIDKYKNI